MQIDKVMNVLVKQIDDKVEQLKEAVLVGNLDYTGYQKICGEVRGLLTARGYVLDLKDRLEKSDE
jgi:uncharacterized protein YaaR (DUF327 family)